MKSGLGAPPSRQPGLARWILCVVVIAGVPAIAQDYKFTISTAQPWTDTGVDLQSGEVVSITASAGAGGCDPAGVTSIASGQSLPVAAALPGALIARLQETGPATLIGASQQLPVSQAGHLYLGVHGAGAA